MGSNGPVANIPIPPALDTDATNGGVDIQLMPGSKMGYLHPRSFVKRVLTAGQRMVDSNYQAIPQLAR